MKYPVHCIVSSINQVGSQSAFDVLRRVLPLCALLLAGGVTARAASFAWTPTAGGTFNWDDATSNWTSGFPNAIDDAAVLSTNITGDQLINLNQAITLGALTLKDTTASNKYTIAAGTSGSLTFQVSTGSATITNTSTIAATNNIINAPITFASNTTINAGATQFCGLTINGSISGSNVVTMQSSGAANLILRGDNSAFTGSWVLSGAANSQFNILNDNNLGAVPGSPTVSITAASTNVYLNLNGATLNVNRTIQINSGVTLKIIPGTNGTINGKITGAGNLAHDQGTTLFLTNATSDFTGSLDKTTAGAISITSIADSGVASAAGAGSAINFLSATQGGTGQLLYTGTGHSSNRDFRLTSQGTMQITNNGTGALNLTGTNNAVTSAHANARVIQLDGSNTGSNIFSEKLNANGAGAVSLVKDGAGTWTVAHASSDYTGTTTIKNGILKAASLNRVSGGTAGSSLGAPVTIANGTIGLGSTAATGQLTYTGTGESTDRVINLAGTTGGAKIDQSGTGLLKFESSFTATGAGLKTLTLQGSTTGTGEIAGAIVDNNGINKTSLTKAGTGTWTLSGANTYTGATTVNGGSLIVNGSLAAGSAVTVQSGGTLGGSGTIGGTVTVTSGGFLAPGNSPGVLTVGSLTLAAGSTTSLEIGGAVRGAGYDGITVGTTSGLTYGGTLSLAFTSTLANLDTLDLFSFTGTAGGAFTSVVSTGSYAGTWTEGSGVWTFTGNDQLLTFDLSTGDLSVIASVVPEPSTYALVGGALALAFAGWRSRRRFRGCLLNKPTHR